MNKDHVMPSPNDDGIVGIEFELSSTEIYFDWVRLTMPGNGANEPARLDDG